MFMQGQPVQSSAHTYGTKFAYLSCKKCKYSIEVEERSRSIGTEGFVTSLLRLEQGLTRNPSSQCPCCSQGVRVCDEA